MARNEAAAFARCCRKPPAAARPRDRARWRFPRASARAIEQGGGKRIGRGRVEHQRSELGIGVLPRSIAPSQQGFARRARQRKDRPDQRSDAGSPVDGAMCLAHRAQSQPCAAAFVADGKSPPANGHAQTIAAQRFADAAGTGSDDRPGPSFVCAEQGRIRVGVERDLRKRRCAPQKLFITLPHVRACETEAKRASLARCGREPRVGERAVDRLPDVFPRLLDPLAEARTGRTRQSPARRRPRRRAARGYVCRRRRRLCGRESPGIERGSTDARPANEESG
jgi:hypothetical protein